MKHRACVYCGEATRNRVACAAHRDLLILDPHYFAPPTMRKELQRAADRTAKEQ